jgi:hypothetical protein
MLGVGHQPAHQRPDRVGAQEHRFREPARMQQARGEDVAALAIGTELDLIDREELDRPVERHRLDGADEIGRIGRQDLLFAGDQSDRTGTAQLDDPVIIFPRQEPQRKADHAALMIEHALDREMGLAGVGRTEDRDKARSVPQHGHVRKVRSRGREGKHKRAGAALTRLCRGDRGRPAWGTRSNRRSRQGFLKEN